MIAQCKCGARVRFPEERVGQLLRCPRCRTEFLATPDARLVTPAAAAPGEAGGTCPICQSTIEPGELTLRCPVCEQVHHRECWAEVGGCSTYGCPQAPALGKQDPTASPVLSAWGDTKDCPACGEKIKAIALRCRYCGTDFDTVDPLTVGDLRKRARREESLKTLRAGVIALFAFSILGCTAPVVLVVNLCWFLPKRRAVARAGPFYTVAGYASLVIAVLYSFLGVCFLLFGRG